MHVAIALLYGGTIWLSVMAYMLINGGPFWTVAACGPFVITGAMAALWALEWVMLCGARFVGWVVSMIHART